MGVPTCLPQHQWPRGSPFACYNSCSTSLCVLRTLGPFQSFPAPSSLFPPVILELLVESRPGPGTLCAPRPRLEECSSELHPVPEAGSPISWNPWAGGVGLLSVFPLLLTLNNVSRAFLRLCCGGGKSCFVLPVLLTLNIKDPCGPVTSCWGTLYNTVSKGKLTWQVGTAEVFLPF